MAITANKKFWTEFIDIYHSLPSLWNTKDENYNNRESRSLARNKLVEKLQEVEPDANQDSVKRKINTFRSNFNREVRKIRQAQKEQPTEVYSPTLWYFDHLSFLLNQEKYNSTSVSVDNQYDDEMTSMGHTTTKSEILENETSLLDSINQDEMTGNDLNTHYEKVVEKTSKLHSRVQNNSRDKRADEERKPSIEGANDNEKMQTEFTPADKGYAEAPNLTLPESRCNAEKLVKSSTARILRSNIKRAKLRSRSQAPYSRYQLTNKALSSLLTDEAAIYGQSWSCGFRKLSPRQKLFAKKAIDEILILGQLNALKLNTVHISANLLEETSDQD